MSLSKVYIRSTDQYIFFFTNIFPFINVVFVVLYLEMSSPKSLWTQAYKLHAPRVSRLRCRCMVFTLLIGKLAKYLFEKWLSEHTDPGAGCPANL